ncbi:MAG: 16S rRNA (guanine(966)-N(2))-methyltransferase RsmD [Gemmatimonadota bacterium]
MRIIGGEWGGRRISAPAGRDTRPTTDRVREAWMSAVAPWLPGADVLDLYAGSGALGIEALSRGAARATFVETASAAARVIQANLSALAVPADRVRVIRTDALLFVAGLDRCEYTVAFADPPYGTGAAARLAGIFRATPFARVLTVEHSRDESIPPAPDLRTRRYGDTTLSFLTADDDSD